MERTLRVAAVGALPDLLVGQLRDLPLRPDVRAFHSLVGDSEAIARLQPDLIVIAFGADGAEEIGALRLLRQLWPTVGAIVVAEPASELQWAPVAARLRAQLVVRTDRPGELAAAVEQALLGSDRPRASVFVDLAHGIADEINNPLQSAAGHLQLLRGGLEAVQDRDRRDQIAAAQQGLARILAVVERLRLLAAAADGPRRRETLDLAALLHEQLPASANLGALSVHLPTTALFVLGDREQLIAAIAAVLRTAEAVTATGAVAELRIEPLPGAVALRLVAKGSSLQAWQLPHSFEPYYPARVLRGHGQGLGLFLAQTVVLGHGGQARGQRLADGSLRFDFVLPTR